MADEHVYVGEEGAKELYRRIKSLIPAVDDSLDITSGNAISNRAVTEALGMVTSFVKAEGTGPDNHPDVENPSGRVIYLVHDELAPNPDQYKEWIWSTPPGEEPMWECIGDTSGVSGDSWKLWSENRDSYGDDESVYIGSNTVVEGTNSVAVGHDNTVDSDSNNTSVFGKGNSVIGGNGNVVVGKANTVAGSEQEVFGTRNSSIGEHNLVAGENTSVSRDDTVAIGQGNQVEVTDETDYSGTDVVEIGTGNTAIDAAYAYQLGRENRVSGNNLENREEYPHGLSLNLGRNNTITGEGVNLGKDNTADTFGINVGQGNTAHNAAIVLGEDNEADHGSIALGKREVTLYNTSYPALKVGDKYYPVVVSSIAPSTYHYTYSVGFDKDGFVQDISYDTSKPVHNCYFNSITLKVWFWRVGNNQISFNARNASGYTDDNGEFIETTVSPDPEHPIQNYIVVTYDDQGTTKTFVATNFSHISEPLVPNGCSTDFRCTEYYTLTPGEVYDRDFLVEHRMWFPVVYTSSDPTYGGVWVDEVNNQAKRCTTSDWSGSGYGPKETVHVTGFDKDGTFYPYNGNNNTESQTLYTRDFKSSDVQPHAFGADELEELGLPSLDTFVDWVPADNNSMSIGDAQVVRNKSAGISAATARIPFPTVGYGYGYRYRNLTVEGEGEEYVQVPLVDDHNDTSTWPNENTRPALSCIENGSIGLITQQNIIPPSSMYITNGSIGIGDSGYASDASVIIGSGSSAYKHSYTFGSSGLYANENSIAIGINGISAQNGSVRLGMNSGTAYNGSVAIGFNSVCATNGSSVLGNNSSAATNGSITVGNDGAFTYNGSFLLGRSSYIRDGSFGIGSDLYASSGAFVFGRNSRAEDGGITIASSGNSISTYRSAAGYIIKYKNPDNIYVPIMGSVSTKPGYRITKVRRCQSTYTYDNKSCYLVEGYYDSGYGQFNSFYQQVALYDIDGNYIGTVSRTKDMSSMYYGTTGEYWLIYNETTDKYTFVDASYDNPVYNETNNLEKLKAYLRVQCRTFTKDGQLYVYANGFNYPDTGLTYEYIDVDTCTFNTYDFWTYAMLGYDGNAWHQLTDVGGYGQGIAIGRDAHAQGSSLALGTNNGNSNGGNTVEIENSVYAQGDNLPTSIGIRIKTNYTHANGYSVALGTNGVTAEGSSMAIGYGNVRSYGYSLALGYSTNIADECSLAIGRNSNSATDYSFAIGDNGNYAEHFAFAVGTSGNTARGYSVAMGYNNNSTDMSTAVGRYSVAETYSTSLGDSAYAYHYGMSMGNYTKAMDYAVSLGKNTRSYSYSVAIGDGCEAYNYSVNIGKEGYAGNRSVSVGASNSAYHYSIAFGRDNTAGGYPNQENDSNAESIAMGISNRAYSYGISVGRYNTTYAKTLAVGSDNSMNYPDSSPYGTLIGHSNYLTYGGYNLGIGLENSVGYEAIAIGRNNLSYNWSILMGFNNSVNQNNGAHATLIGVNNSSTSNLEQIYKSALGGTFITNSFISGTNNTSNHYNSILIGALNTSLAPLITPSEPVSGSTYDSTSDDGFMLALGLKNTVGRNYDIAIGYMSTANGGENTAIHQSYATGFRNFALNKSSIYNGVSNFAINESTLSVPYNAEYDRVKCNRTVSYNTLTYSEVSSSSTFDSGMLGNTFRNSIVSFGNSATCFNGNVVDLIFHGKPLNISARTLTQNIIFGYRNSNYVSGDGSIAFTGNEFNRNILINNGYASAVDSGGENFNDNIICSTDIGGHLYSMQGVCAFDSALDIQADAKIIDSVFLGKSKAYVRYSDSSAVHQYNFLFGSMITDRTVPGAGDNSPSDSCAVQFNVLFGSNVYNSNNCFSVSDFNSVPCDGTGTPSINEDNSATLVSSRRIYNFGDNTSRRSVEAFIEGLDNKIVKAQRSILLGYNNFIYSANHPSSDGSASDNVLIGSENAIYAYSAPQILSGYDIRNKQLHDASSIYKVEPNKVTVGYDFYYYDHHLMQVTSIDLYSNYAYVYDGDAISTSIYLSDFAQHGVVPVDISFNDFNQRLRNGTLAGSTAYRFTDGSGTGYIDSSVVLYRGIVMYPDTVYNLLYEYEESSAQMNPKLIVHVLDGVDEYADGAVESCYNYLFGANNTINATKVTFNNIIGCENSIARYYDISSDAIPHLYEREIMEYFSAGLSMQFIPRQKYYLPFTTATISRINASSSEYYIYNYGYLGRVWISSSKPQPDPSDIISMSGADIYNGCINKTLVPGKYYQATSSYSFTSMRALELCNTNYAYEIDISNDGIKSLYTIEDKTKKYNARNSHGNLIIGANNLVHENVMNYTLLGTCNEVISSNSYDSGSVNGIGNGLIQGNNNIARFGSNIVSIGNGNLSVGHNSVAIGTQLISKQWQTVIGKYNSPIDGPGRLDTEHPQDSDKALFIIGNGYTTNVGIDWQDEYYVTRSNAMVVYADGTVKAKRFISDEPEFDLISGTGIQFTDNVQNNTRTVSLSNDVTELVNFLSTRPSTGRYAINSIDGVLTWVPIGTESV